MRMPQIVRRRVRYDHSLASRRLKQALRCSTKCNQLMPWQKKCEHRVVDGGAIGLSDQCIPHMWSRPASSFFCAHALFLLQQYTQPMLGKNHWWETDCIVRKAKNITYGSFSNKCLSFLYTDWNELVRHGSQYINSISCRKYCRGSQAGRRLHCQKKHENLVALCHSFLLQFER